MSIKIMASYETDTEQAYLTRLFQHLQQRGARIRSSQGKPYRRIYVTYPAQKRAKTRHRNGETGDV